MQQVILDPFCNDFGIFDPKFLFSISTGATISFTSRNLRMSD